MRGRKKTSETRSAIVCCAAEIFSQSEFHEVLTDDIAQRIGIGKGTIYRYFRSKEELYVAAIAQGLDGLHAAVADVLRQDEPLEATIEALVRTTINYFWHHRDFFVLIHRIEPKLKAEERADWQKRRLETINLLRRVVERAASRGEIGPVNSRLAVELLLGMIRTACMARTGEDCPEDLTRVVTGIFLRGIRGYVGRHKEGALKIVGGDQRGLAFATQAPGLHSVMPAISKRGGAVDKQPWIPTKRLRE